jgi:ribosomal protein S18 acetylase RimI-like enzyme
MDGDPVRAFLHQDPVRNAFCLGWVEEFDVWPMDASLRFQFWGCWRRTGLAGVALLAGHRIVCLSQADAEAAHVLGQQHRRLGLQLRTVLGPRAATEAFWQGYAPLGTPAADLRPQRLLDLPARELRYFPAPQLQLAMESDGEELLALALAMHAEEVGTPVAEHEVAAFRSNLLTRIEAGRTWVLREPLDGRIVFKASLSSRTAEVSQVEGVYVLPAWRGRGVARRALSEMCRQVLTESARVTLFTDESNAPALRLYQRLGFRDAGAWATVWTG